VDFTDFKMIIEKEYFRIEKSSKNEFTVIR